MPLGGSRSIEAIIGDDFEGGLGVAYAVPGQPALRTIVTPAGA